MIVLNDSQKEKILELIKLLPIEDSVKDRWTQAVQAEKTPKSVLFDIAVAMETIETFKNQPNENNQKVDEFFGEMRDESNISDKKIGAKLDRIEAKIRKFELEQKLPVPGQSHPATNTQPPIDATV